MIGKLKSSLLFIVVISSVALISFGTFWIGKNATKRETEKIEDCPTKGSDHVVEIKDDRINPEYIKANVCDELTVVNKDNKLRLIAFGVHDEHIYYDGITEEVLKTGQSLSVTLNQTGTYIFHDHLQDEVQGRFEVQ